MKIQTKLPITDAYLWLISFSIEPLNSSPIHLSIRNAFKMSGTFSTADVSSHNKPNDLWIIVDQDVYDLTKFQDDHPGGKKSMSTALPNN